MEERALTVDMNSRASNPGRVPVQFGVFLRCFPRLTLFSSALLLILLSFTLVHWLFWIPVVLLVAFYWLAMVRVREHFRHGCVNPGLVVAHRPDRIAVLTDLTTGGGHWPVVKVLEHPLGRATGGRPPVGTRLATVALYQGPGDEGHWDDFFPVAVNCATGDREAIRLAQESIDPLEWLELEEGLRQLENPKQPGLYRVNLSPVARPERAISAGLNRLNPQDLCTFLCPGEIRPAALKLLRELYGEVEVSGDETAWTQISSARGLQLRWIPAEEMGAGLASISQFFSAVPCTQSQRREWAVDWVLKAQQVIVCTGAPRFVREAGHYQAISRIAQSTGALVFTGSSLVDGYGCVVLDAQGGFEAA